MNSKQRKTHLVVWLLLAIGLPVFIFLSVKNLDFNTNNGKTSEVTFKSESTVLKVSENEFIKVNTFKDSIEIILKKPLKNASAVVVDLNSENKSKTLGQISQAGTYRFQVDRPVEKILIMDKIKKQPITTLIL
ncbi:hypothetical protein [Winogradskyella sp. 3972H.M.0a.05]|uniref:hypothetical protein n=1 Tax=Winogradskyella sp. 3972H.M.0a.05 TaxID=2950277 RepID=UPI00339A4629